VWKLNLTIIKLFIKHAWSFVETFPCLQNLLF
jgi:hypothetical protein